MSAVHVGAYSIFSSWCLYVIILTCNPSVLPLSISLTLTVTQLKTDLKTTVTLQTLSLSRHILHLLFKAVPSLVRKLCVSLDFISVHLHSNASSKLT